MIEEKKRLPGLGLVRSLGVSVSHLFQRKITVQYPETPADLGYRFRGRHIFHQDVCIGCTQCERVCPVVAIKMEEHKDPASRKVVVDRFAVDLGICYYCGLCEEVCPTDPKAVHLGPDFELATHDRRLLVYEMDQLTGPKGLPLKPKAAVAAAPAGEKPAVAAAPARPAATPAPAAAAAPEAPAATTPAPTPAPAAEAPAPETPPAATSDPGAGADPEA